MIIVTERAKQELERRLTSANVDDTKIGLRVTLGKPGQFELVTDGEKEGDQVVEYRGAKVLLIGEELAKVLEKATIDCEETTEGTRLVISKE